MLENRFRKIAMTNDIQFCLMLEKDTVDTIILKRLQEYLAKQKKLHICIVETVHAQNK